MGIDIKNIVPLKYLTELKKIKIMKGSYSSLEPLSELSNLKEIELSHKKMFLIYLHLKN